MPARSNPTVHRVAKQTCRALRRSQTKAERLLWEALRDRKFAGLKFYRQYPLFVDWLGTETFFVADFFCFEKRLVIEVDGKIHDYRRDHDQVRTFIINGMGIPVVRFRNADIEEDIGGVLERLRTVLA